MSQVDTKLRPANSSRASRPRTGQDEAGPSQQSGSCSAASTCSSQSQSQTLIGTIIDVVVFDVEPAEEPTPTVLLPAKDA